MLRVTSLTYLPYHQVSRILDILKILCEKKSRYFFIEIGLSKFVKSSQIYIGKIMNTSNMNIGLNLGWHDKVKNKISENNKTK